MSRSAKGTTIVVAAGAVVLSLLSPATAGQANDATSQDPIQSTTQTSATRSVSTVTLVTGDAVQVTREGDHTSVAVNGAASGSFQVYEKYGDTFVVPFDAAAQLRAGTLDEALFNVDELLRDGYGDSDTNKIPLIVTYRQDLGRQALAARGAALPASQPDRALPSIDAAVVQVTKGRADTFWTAVDGVSSTTTKGGLAAKGALSQGIGKIWLDGVSHVTLDQSVPLIGAPEAWAAGYDGKGTNVAILDTGADLNHPDLAGRVTAQADFTGKGSVADGHGHGTHVASIVGGSGAASGGSRKGVAPAANLMIGKVLGDDGSGPDSQVIAGMEWAANNGADVVNMSLGSTPTNGQDPLSQAVNNLTASSGTLFVIAAGNDGPGDHTVDAPGTADSALTVSNFSKTDQLTASSSIGPRYGDEALKPDIAAPGTSIVAARAAGTSLGTPVDDYYTSLTGTSMATPHVAGAAAILKERFPNLSPEELKSRLVSTAKRLDGYDVYKQGGGRLDVARAVRQGVYAGPTPISHGRFPYPQTDIAPVTTDVTLTNTTSDAVTLATSAEVSDQSGNAAPAGAVTVGADSVTVPANGSTTVAVTVAPALAGTGVFSGFFQGVGPDGLTVSLPIGFTNAPESYPLTITVKDRNGDPNRGATVQVGDVNDSSKYLQFPSFDSQGQATLMVPPGTYSVLGVVNTTEPDHTYSYSFVGDPEVQIDKTGADVLLDAQKAVKVDPVVNRDTETVTAKLEFWRMPVNGAPMSYRYLLGEPFTDIYATPTSKDVTKGEFHLVTQHALVEPDLKISAGRLPDMTPDYFIYSPKLANGSSRMRIVDVGQGDYTNKNVDGAVALISAVNGQWSEQITAAAAHGAVAALLYWDAEWPFFGAVEQNLPIPGAALTLPEARRLQAWLKAGGGKVGFRSVRSSPYLYDLRFDEDGHVSKNLRHKLTSRDFAQVDNEFRALAPQQQGGDIRPSFAPWQLNSTDSNRPYEAPIDRVDYINAQDDYLYWQQVSGVDTPDLPFGNSMRDAVRYLQPRERLDQTWYGAPRRSSPRVERTAQDRVLEPCPACRDDDEMFFWIEDYGDSEDGHYGAFDTRWENSATRLYRNDELIQTRRTGRNALAVPAEDGDYRLEIDSWSDAPWTAGTRNQTVWKFRSQAPTRNGALPSWYECFSLRGTRNCDFLPMVFLDYDLPLDGLNRAPAGRYTFTASVDAQPFAPSIKARDLKVQVSYDDGTTWTDAAVRRQHGNRFTVTVNQPRNASYASLRITGTATNGSQVTEQLIRAYAIR